MTNKVVDKTTGLGRDSFIYVHSVQDFTHDTKKIPQINNNNAHLHMNIVTISENKQQCSCWNSRQVSSRNISQSSVNIGLPYNWGLTRIDCRNKGIITKVSTYLALTLSLDEIPLRLLPATLSVSEAICCTMVLFGTFPSCIELSRSSVDLLDFFLPFFLPTFLGIMSQNTSEVSHVDISHRKISSKNDYEDCKRDQSKKKKLNRPPYFRCHAATLDPVRSQCCCSLLPWIGAVRVRVGVGCTMAFFQGQYSNHSGGQRWAL